MMWKLKFVFLFVGQCAIVVTEAAVTITSVKSNDGHVFQESIKKFQDFSNDFYQKSFSLLENPGAVVVFPYGVAHMLATLNAQNVWNVSTDGVDYALWTSKENLTEEYSALLGVINREQNNFRGVITSWGEYLSPSASLQKLNVKLETQAVEYNSEHETVFQSSWDHSQRGDASNSVRRALFANTMFLSNYWLQELSAVGGGVFNGDVNIPFLESKRYLRMHETKDFIAVSIPLATFGQNLILVLPESNMGDVVNKKTLQHFIQSPPKSSVWKFHPLRVFIPALNFITPGNFLKPLAKLGVQNLMCKHWTEAELQLQPINQATYLYLGTDGFDILTITSADLLNTTEYRNPNNLFKREIRELRLNKIEKRNRRSPQTQEENQEFLSKVGFNPLSHFGGSFDQDLLLWAAYEASNPTGNVDYKTVVFNKPFYWYLHDENLGPTFAGIIESVRQTPKTYYEEPFARKNFNQWIKDMDKTYPVPRCPL